MKRQIRWLFEALWLHEISRRHEFMGSKMAMLGAFIFFGKIFAASSSKHENLNQVGEPKCDIAMAFMAFMAICSFLSMTTLLLFPQAAAGGDVCTDCDDVELLQFKDDQRGLETFLAKTTREAYQTNVHPIFSLCSLTCFDFVSKSFHLSSQI